jgi:hypothetical protein
MVDFTGSSHGDQDLAAGCVTCISHHRRHEVEP